MAIALGQHAVASTAGASSVTTGAVTTQASGSNFYLLISFRQGDTFNGVSDSKGNTYTQVDTLADGGYGWTISTYRCENGTGGSGHTATVTMGATTRIVCYFVEITGAVLSGATDQHSIAKDTSSPFDGTALTTTQANEILLGIVRSNDTVNTTITVNGGMTQLDIDATNTASVAFYRALSATGTYSPAATSSPGGTQAIVAMLSIKEASGGGSTVKRLVDSILTKERLIFGGLVR